MDHLAHCSAATVRSNAVARLIAPVFHESCLRDWFNTKARKVDHTCPGCRAPAEPFKSRIAKLILDVKWLPGPSSSPIKPAAAEEETTEDDTRKLIRDMRNGARDMREELAGLRAAHDAMAEELAAERAKAAELQTKLEESKRTATEGKRELAVLKAGSSKLTKELSAARTDLRTQHLAHQTELEQVHKRHSDDVADLTHQLDVAKTAQRESEDERNQLRVAIADADAKLTRGKSDRERLRKGIDSYKEKLSKAQSDAEELRSQLDVATARASSPHDTSIAGSVFATSPALSRAIKRPRMSTDVEAIDVDALDDFIAPGLPFQPPRRPLARIPSGSPDFAFDTSKKLAIGPKSTRRLKPV